MDLALRPSPGSTSAPPPSWIVLCLERLEATPWGGLCHDPVHALPVTHHQRSLAHHTDSCTTLTVAHHLRLHFPSTIALITKLSPITHCTDYTAEFHQTRFISLDFFSLIAEYCFATANISEHFHSCGVSVDYLDCLYSSDRLLPALSTQPAFWIFSLSAACTD